MTNTTSIRFVCINSGSYDGDKNQNDFIGDCSNCANCGESCSSCDGEIVKSFEELKSDSKSYCYHIKNDADYNRFCSWLDNEEKFWFDELDSIYREMVNFSDSLRNAENLLAEVPTWALKAWLDHQQDLDENDYYYESSRSDLWRAAALSNMWQVYNQRTADVDEEAEEELMNDEEAEQAVKELEQLLAN